MTPIKFAEANRQFGPPQDLVESQVMTIWAYAGRITSGSLDGALQVVVAWQPSAEELKALNEGKPLFLSFVGGLPAHFPCTSFEEATHPA